VLSVGGSTRLATTNAAGSATASVPLVSLPGTTDVTASFGGDEAHLPSDASAPFTLAKAPASLSAFPAQLPVVTAGGATGVVTTLSAALGAETQPLLQQTVTFTLGGAAGTKTYSTITDYLGRAPLPSAGLAAGTYSVTASFAGDATYTGATRSGTLVVSAFGGFLAPVDPPPTLNVTKARSAVPVRFSLGGDRGLAIFAAGYPRVVAIAFDSRAATDDVETTVTAGASGLQFANGEYTYVWKTAKGSMGCQRLELKLVDGSVFTADFRLK